MVALTGGSLRADPITVDGNWNDWGINPDSGDWTASTGSRVFFEDYRGTGGTAYLGPGWGGQFFDVEAIYATMQGSTVFFAIVTGFDPDGVVHGGTTYLPGDIFFDVGSGWNVGVDLETGNIFTGVSGTTPMFSSSGPFTLVGGTNVGVTPLSIPRDGAMTHYGNGDTSSRHYNYEGSLDLSLVGGLTSNRVGIHWTMSCGNDIGEGYLPKPAVPEPATLGLFGLGGLAALIARRKSGKK